MAASTITAVGLKALEASAAERNIGTQEFYELRAYRWKSGANHAPLEGYLEKAALPALNRLGAKPIGVFTQQDRPGSAAGTEIRDPNTLFLLIPYPTFESFATGGVHRAGDEARLSRVSHAGGGGVTGLTGGPREAVYGWLP